MEVVKAKIIPYLQDYAHEVFGEQTPDEFIHSYRENLRSNLFLEED